MLARVASSRSLGVVCGLASLALGAHTARESWRDLDVEVAAALLLHLLAAVLFVARRPPRAVSLSPRSIAVTAASVSYVLLFDLNGAAGSDAAVRVGLLLAMLGWIGCLASTATLGRAYGVLPADRGLETGGLYRWLRHPLYASYLLLDLSILCARPSPRNGLVLAAGAALFVLRIADEERLLASPAYAAYARRVRFRLLPPIY